MKKIWIYKYITYNKSKILKALFLLFVIIVASVPVIMLLNEFTPPKDKSASFILSYDTPDLDFGTIDYSGIEYFIDGVSYLTTSDTISIVLNSNEVNFTMYFGGEIFTYIFSEDITQAIVLPTKSISSIVMWEGIEVPVYNSLDNSFDLLWFNGTDWITIATGLTTDVTGLISIDNLITGNYMLVETGETYLDAYEEFTIVESTIIYEEVIYLIPETSVIDVDYLITIFGTDYPVDLTGVDWVLMWTQSYGTSWKLLTAYPEISFYAYLDDSNAANGIITIYELLDHSGVQPLYYEIVIGNAWNTAYDITIDGLTEVDLTAKSLEATWTWSFDDSPAVGEEFELFWWNGIGFEVVGTYVTDTFGMITITELLPIGTYRFDDLLAFDITVDDDLIIVAYTMESILGKEKSNTLDFVGTTKSNIFYFITLIVNKRVVDINWIFVFWISPEYCSFF